MRDRKRQTRAAQLGRDDRQLQHRDHIAIVVQCNADDAAAGVHSYAAGYAWARLGRVDANAVSLVCGDHLVARRRAPLATCSLPDQGHPLFESDGVIEATDGNFGCEVEFIMWLSRVYRNDGKIEILAEVIWQ